MIEWKVKERLIANEKMFEVVGVDGDTKCYGGLFPTLEDAQEIADKLNKAQKGEL